MSISRILALCAALLVTTLSQPSFAAGTAGTFDYYVLSLSWSPTFCMDKGKAKDNPQQCGKEKHYAFVVHGLWPQYQKSVGGAYWPESCATREPTDVSDQLSSTMLDIMPSDKLIDHEWEKHGTCSGLSQKDYFGTIRKVYQRLAIPADFQKADEIRTTTPKALETAFISSNAGLKSDGISLLCKKRRLVEIHICLNKDLSFRSCPELEKDDCNSSQLTLPAKR